MPNSDRLVTSEQLYAASLDRVYCHTRSRNIGIVTAHRNEASATEKRIRNGQLRDDIRAHGLGFIKVRVRYIENEGKPDEHKVHDETFLIIGKSGPDNGHLKGFLKTHGNKYGQDYVLHKSNDSENVYLIGVNGAAHHGLNVIENLGQWNPGRMGEFLSKLKWGRFSSPKDTKAITGRSYGNPSMRFEFLRGPTFFLRREVLY